MHDSNRNVNHFEIENMADGARPAKMKLKNDYYFILFIFFLTHHRTHYWNIWSHRRHRKIEMTRSKTEQREIMYSTHFRQREEVPIAFAIVFVGIVIRCAMQMSTTCSVEFGWTQSKRMIFNSNFKPNGNTPITIPKFILYFRFTVLAFVYNPRIVFPNWP